MPPVNYPYRYRLSWASVIGWVFKVMAPRRPGIHTLKTSTIPSFQVELLYGVTVQPISTQAAVRFSGQGKVQPVIVILAGVLEQLEQGVCYSTDRNVCMAILSYQCFHVTNGNINHQHWGRCHRAFGMHSQELTNNSAAGSLPRELSLSRVSLRNHAFS